MAKNTKHLPNLGIGIGLRMPHYEDIFEHKPPIDWFEIISENFMVDGGKPIENLERSGALSCCPAWRYTCHRKSGSFRFRLLEKTKSLAKKTKTPWISDHLCWGRLPGAHYHDLLPLPYTKEVIDYVAERARVVQDFWNPFCS